MSGTSLAQITFKYMEDISAAIKLRVVLLLRRDYRIKS